MCIKRGKTYKTAVLISQKYVDQIYLKLLQSQTCYNYLQVSKMVYIGSTELRIPAWIFYLKLIKITNKKQKIQKIHQYNNMLVL